MTERRFVFIHASDELYGADRVLLDIAAALPEEVREVAEFWVPIDLPHGTQPLCERLQAAGASVRHVDVPVLRRAYRNPRDLAALGRRTQSLTRLLRTTSPDVVYLSTSAVLLAAPAARRAGVRRILCHVQEIWSARDAKILGPLARACAELIAISSPVRGALPPRLQDRTTIVLNATTSPGRVTPLAGREGPLSFVIASRWNGWKGHRTLLSAWDQCSDPGRLVVLGGPPASGATTDVPHILRGMRSAASVEVIGEVSDTATHIEAADVVVVPSDDPEPFGLVAIEAFARGRSVIASDAGGLADIVTHGSDGWLFPPGDVDALRDLLDGLTRDEVEDAGVCARRTFEERFTDERFRRDWNRVVLSEPERWVQ